jgi:hypothetical protein
MPADANLILFPRGTTLVSRDNFTVSFTSNPVDTSGHGSAQFQLWRGHLSGSSPTFKAWIEESLDGVLWSSPAGGSGFDPGENGTKALSYAFRLRWFRLRLEVKANFVSCRAEGLLR